MIRTRLVAVALTGAFLMTVAACGGDDADTTAGSTPTTAATTAAAEATTAPAEPTEAAAPADDKALCQEADKAAKAMTKAMVTLVGSGTEPSAGDYKAILDDMDRTLTEAVGTADSKVAAAMKEVAAQSAKAAAAPDPVEAAGDPAFEKAGTSLNAACKKVGVKVKF
ncbi:hypothetical protein [Actinoplanes aureus]|uniref:Lipoprotein n=1 Tax=Actinoplanes aureus TaxID=2792083 RepID=A0A931G0L8_9ACTN|nr:hypothetical protein [Actinoplanes aureus]MBG0564196.1 hypothetical protein [Actinoplanes aureus]